MSKLEQIISAVLQFAPNATVGEHNDGELVIYLAMSIDPDTGDAVPFPDEDVFDG